MNATVVTIGDEILIGQVLDTNSQYISKALDKIGIQIHEMCSISDDRNHILETFERVQQESQIIIITGGLGPTKDDITKKTLAAFFNDTLVRDENVLRHVEGIFEKYSGKKQPLLQSNIDQALVLSKAEVLFNQYGTAPGMWIKNDKAVFISLPGVPFEMKALMNDVVVPKLVAEFNRPYIVHKTILTYGVGESLLADRISNWEDNLPENIKLAYLPAPGRVRLRLSAKGFNLEQIREEIENQVALLTQIISDAIVGFEEEETLEAVVGKLLTEKGLTVATAESCTGGKIAQTLTSIPGSSAYYKGSVVCYAKAVKTEIVGVNPKTIETHSVVSEAVAQELALNISKLLNTDIGIGVTGNAGPTTDDTDESVGVVYIGVAFRNEVTVNKFNFGQPREKVIDRAVVKSLEMLREIISEKK